MTVAHPCLWTRFVVSDNVSLLKYMLRNAANHVFVMCPDSSHIVIHADFYVRPIFELYNIHVAIAVEFSYGITSPRHPLPLSFYEFFHWYENGRMLFHSGDSLGWVRFKLNNCEQPR